MCSEPPDLVNLPPHPPMESGVSGFSELGVSHQRRKGFGAGPHPASLGDPLAPRNIYGTSQLPTILFDSFPGSPRAPPSGWCSFLAVSFLPLSVPGPVLTNALCWPRPEVIAFEAGFPPGQLVWGRWGQRWDPPFLHCPQ